MSQQINLLNQKREPVPSWVWALAGLALVLCGLLAYYATLQAQNRRQEQEADAGAAEIARAEATLQALQKRLIPEKEAADLKAEIAALRPRAEAVKQLLAEVNSGSLGNPEGFAKYFNALEGVTEEGLWITAVTVDKGGKSVSVSGRAMRNESVMQFAKRLNQVFSPFGVQFNSLEMTPESVNAAGGRAAVTAVSFRLS